MEDNLSDNRDDINFEDNVCSNQHSRLEEPAPLQLYDEQQLNDMQAVLPFLKGKGVTAITTVSANRNKC